MNSRKNVKLIKLELNQKFYRPCEITIFSSIFCRDFFKIKMLVVSFFGGCVTDFFLFFLSFFNLISYRDNFTKKL